MRTKYSQVKKLSSLGLAHFVSKLFKASTGILLIRVQKVKGSDLRGLLPMLLVHLMYVKHECLAMIFLKSWFDTVFNIWLSKIMRYHDYSVRLNRNFFMFSPGMTILMSELVVPGSRPRSKGWVYKRQSCFKEVKKVPHFPSFEQTDGACH